MLRAVQPRKTLFAPIALLAILAMMTGFLVYNHFDTARVSKARVLHSHEVIEAAQTLFSDVQDVESGARGFLIAGNTAHLSDYRNGLAQYPMAASRLEALVRDSPEQRDRARRIGSLLKARADIAAMRVEMGLAGKLDEARTARFGAGKAAMDEARVILRDLINSEKALLNERTKESAFAEWIGIVIALTVIGLAIIGLGILVVALFRANKAMELEIHAREISESARREADVLYRAVFDNAEESVFVITVEDDGTYTLLDVNPAFEKAADTSIAAIRGLDIRKVQPGPTGEALVAYYDSVISAGQPILVRLELPMKQGLRIWESTLVPVRDEIGRIHRIVGAGRDVTERERAEAQSRNAQKMEAIGHLTGGVAHDFNNLLQVIRGNLELLEPHLKDVPQAKQRLKNALHGADRAAQLTRQLLAFARRQPLEPKVVNLGRLVNDMADLLRRSLGEAVEVETVIAGGLWNTLADPAQVESAILNLAINARDAMPTGGRLTIELTNAALDDAYALKDPADIEPGQYVLLAISDTGHGMTPETAARVFEPFFTTKGIEKGTGLGLSMVYGFVKQSHGHIQVYSEVDEGTTIKIYLPRSRKAEDLAPAPTLTRFTGRSEVILVVEDEEMVRTAAVGMLREMGYSCIHADNAQAALDMLEGGVKVDLLFTDVIMPGPLKSRDMAAKAQAMHPGLPVLFTSGYTENAIVHHGRLDEGVHLLSKPYQKEDLVRRVRTLLDAAKPVVLIVEDEPLVRMAAVDMIEELGFTVLEAGDGPEAMKVITAAGRIDILFCDIGLPGMRGPELVKKALKLRPELKVIFASGYGEGADGVDGGVLLSKPYDRDDLADTLRG